MRRVLFPLLVIGLAGGLFSLGSGAFFSDVEEDTGNTITAGTLDLQHNAGASTSCSIANFVPTGTDIDFDGPAEACVTQVENVGSITGDLYLRIDIIDNDNGCTEPETVAGDATCGAGGGELSSQLNKSTCTDVASAGTEATQPCADGTTLGALAQTCAKVVDDFVADATYTITVDLTDATTNLSQSDSTTINFYWELVQVDQTASAGCGGPA